MPKLIDMSEVSFAIFTGDVVSHDPADQLSQAYDSYEEEVTYQTFKAGLGGIVSSPLRKRDADSSLFTRRWETMIPRHKHGLPQIHF
jgi:hypothetical protein